MRIVKCSSRTCLGFEASSTDLLPSPVLRSGSLRLCNDTVLHPSLSGRELSALLVSLLSLRYTCLKFLEVYDL